MGFTKSIKGLFDPEYRKDKAIAEQHAGIDLSYEVFEELKEKGVPLSKIFSPVTIMSEYTHSGSIEGGVDPKVKLQDAIVVHIEEHADILTNG